MTKPLTSRFGGNGDLKNIDGLTEYCEYLSNFRPYLPFDSKITEFCNRYSKALLQNPHGRLYPQIISLGYWLRPAAINKLIAGYPSQPGLVRVPRGLAFHLPPANVDTIFIYSWILSLLAGNCNIVRLPKQINPVAQILLDCLETCADDTLRKSNLFISYERDDNLTTLISQYCSMRIVWGGDEKAIAIRQIPLSPNAIDLNFANRFSMCAIAIEPFASLDGEQVAVLAGKFYNDAFWFDQMGCSSPRIVYWIGARRDEHQERRFYNAVSQSAADKGYVHDIGVAVAKHNFAYQSIIRSGVNAIQRYGNFVAQLDLPQGQDVHGQVQGGGTFFNSYLFKLNDLNTLVRREDQTLSYYGFSDVELSNFAYEIRGRGIDRMVPIGQALNFGNIWDGWDLISEMTRLVHIIGV